MANNNQNLDDVHQKVKQKPGFDSVKKTADGSITVSKNGIVIFPRVIFEAATSRVIIGDGSGVATGDAQAWLDSLK